MRTTVLTFLLAVALVAVTGAAAAETVDVPADVTIDQLSFWFAAVEFSHGDHNDLADDCSACHHDQEPEEISACGDCHGLTYDPSEPDAPDLKMAYHQLCVGCHQEVDAPLACIDCHERRALPGGPELGEAAQK